MKIKTYCRPYEEVVTLPRAPHRRPRRPSFLLRTVARLASIPALCKTHFACRRVRETEPHEPVLILMNHSCFLDLKIASRVLYPRRFGIVCTIDGMVGKRWLMRGLGCIPTQKFVTDMTLIRDMKYMLEKNKTSVLLFPEAGYTFDGRVTALPDSLGGLCKLMDVPVMYLRTEGTFLRDPLYNGLQLRKTRVTAEYMCLFSRETIRTSDAATLQAAIEKAFCVDQLAYQYENKITIDEPFRADGLHRILYKCPACSAEGYMEGKETTLTCHACGKSWSLTEHGRMAAVNGETEFPHIPDWYDWERASVRAELAAGTYRLDEPVTIGMMVDEKALYMVGEGQLVHDRNGFRLDGCDGKLHYEQKPCASHSLNADFYWYEIGDMIGLGNRDALYYCFPQAVEGVTAPVAKVRLAAEELYRMTKAPRRTPQSPPEE